MIALLQRVDRADVEVGSARIAEIGRGIAALIGVQRGDNEASAQRLLDRIASYRLFSDDDGRMNLSIKDVAGDLLLVPQFTLAADTRKGTRAGFSSAAQPEEAERLFNHLVVLARTLPLDIGTGRFGADMRVSLTNNGPVTFWLEVKPDGGTKRDN